MAAEATFEQGLLFEVRSQTGKSSFLFGTIHSEDARVMELAPPVQSAFDEAGSFVMEVIPDPKAIRRAMVAMAYSDGRSLARVVGQDRFREIVAAMKGRGMSPEAIKDFKPWAIVTILGLPPPETGEFLDIHLYKRALAAGKPVHSIETMDEQLAVFDDLSESDQVALLEETLAVLNQLPEVHERLLQAYLQRDLAGLSRLVKEYLRVADSEVDKRFKIAVLDARHARMTERILPFVEKGGYFVAIGALHLTGEDGVLARLEALGFDVRRRY
ncbi:MAG: TraB/GumN family protein [Chromatiaceae bacterium]|nr:TraB/GumN family protein [Chromatiaceae bacterium]